MPNGHIVGTQTLVSHGPPARRFNIVILGDGFQAKQLRTFDARAKSLAQALLALSPFDTVAHLVNVRTVRTISTDRGVSDYPTLGVPKRTFYNVAGFFQVAGLPRGPRGFFGTPTPEVARNAAGGAVPLEQIHLLIMLVNVVGDGASAFPGDQMVFLAPQGSKATLLDLAAHECCHAIAHTADEYLDCTEPEPNKTFPNQATEAERLAGTVKWQPLAQPSELTSAGGFKAVHRFGALDVTIPAGSHTPQFVTNPSLNGMLGLYVGCQDVDVSMPGNPCVDAYDDPLGRGRGFYRPMADCRMRSRFAPFCRVCAHEIVAQIQSFAT